MRNLGQFVIDLVATVGELTLFALHMFAWLFTRKPYRDTLVPTMYQVGVRSVPVVAITGTFIGMVLAVQAFNQFKQLNIESRLGSVINASLVTELGPVLAATMLAGRIGSAMAAEIATMKVTEQIDALRCLGTDPIHYLVVPRFLACVLLIPLLTMLADFMGVLGGALVATKIKHVTEFHYWQHSRDTVETWDILTGIFKTLVFGGAIALVSCFRGFKAGAGAEGVGRAATEAFVLSFVAILVSDFFLGLMLNQVYESIWPHPSGRAGP
ncbi:MAG TPA: ABC transporter permease [Planctomycetia bacterium]|nr:ABC transporter permease [Planctomycetia bacterium]